MILNAYGLRYIPRIFIFILCMECICAAMEAEIKLNVEGNGFHRTLVYHVDFKNLANNDCQAVIYLELPSELYVNVDDTATIKTHGTTTVCSVGETDVELFAEKAGRQNITTCAFVNLSLSILTIPLHQRYEYVRETGGYVNVSVPKPKLLLGCRERIREHRVSKTDSLCETCVSRAIKWREIPYRTSNDRDYMWSIPVGESSFSTFVTCVTLLTTIVSAIFIGHTIWSNILKNQWKED